MRGIMPTWEGFGAFPLWLNGLVLFASAVVVWFAGSRLAVYADIIADRSGLGQAFVGLLILASATSLPEIGRTIGASVIGNAPLAVDSLFGGISLQTMILAIADLTVARRALTYFAPKPVLLLEGVAVVLLSLSLAGIAAGEIIEVFGVGLWALVVAIVYVFTLYLLRSYEGREQWRPIDIPEEMEERENLVMRDKHVIGQRPLRTIVLLFTLASFFIFIAGLMLAEVGNALAVQTGLGSGFIGATLLALSSSLPKLSTTITAVRIGAYSLAISNIFGSNTLLVALIFLADVFYRQGPILGALSRSAIFIAAVGIILTSIYLAGMIERRNRVILGMGIDSLIVMIVYIISLVILYLIR